MSVGQDDFEYDDDDDYDDLDCGKDCDDEDDDDDDDLRPAHGATWPDPTVVATWADAALRVNVQSENGDDDGDEDYDGDDYDGVDLEKDHENKHKLMLHSASMF